MITETVVKIQASIFALASTAIFIIPERYDWWRVGALVAGYVAFALTAPALHASVNRAGQRWWDGPYHPTDKL